MDAAHWQQVNFSCKSKIDFLPHASNNPGHASFVRIWSLVLLDPVAVHLPLCALVLGACCAFFDETMISPAPFRFFLGPVLPLYPSYRSMHTIISIYLIHRLWGEAFVALILCCPSTFNP
jgi:hypothetical protein